MYTTHTHTHTHAGAGATIVCRTVNLVAVLKLKKEKDTIYLLLSVCDRRVNTSFERLICPSVNCNQ